MPLQEAFSTIATRLQEGLALSHSDIRTALDDKLNSDFPQSYSHVANVYGDNESGDVVYYKSGKYIQAPYSMGMANGKRAAGIDHSAGTEVIPRTTYDQQADEDDNYASMGEAERSAAFVERFPGSAVRDAPFSERFIGKAERDAATSSDFAWKGKSFPILKREDVKAAVHAMGRAGADNHSPTTLKSNIIRIAKAKGWESELPKAWSGKASEAARTPEAGEVLLVESMARFTEDVPFIEGSRASDYPICLIKPGRGSSGYYTPEVLKNAVNSGLFKAKTHMYWNHPTDAEEAARPEGSMDNLAAVLTEDARWDENGKEGAAVYGRAKPFADFATKIAEKAPYTGLSIRARGKYAESIAPDGKSGLIAALTKGDSVDFVTRPGAGGKVITESQRNSEFSQGDAVDDATITKLITESVATAVKTATADLTLQNKRLQEQLNLTRGPAIVGELLVNYNLPPAVKTRIAKRIVESGIDLSDALKLKETVQREALADAQFLEELGYGRVTNLGGTPPAAVDPKDVLARESQLDAAFKESMNDLASCFLPDGANDAMKQVFTTGRAK